MVDMRASITEVPSTKEESRFVLFSSHCLTRILSADWTECLGRLVPVYTLYLVQLATAALKSDISRENGPTRPISDGCSRSMPTETMELN
jgi:hypothetical protein